ncbi:MAG: UTRA domain-containing protein [Micromonosporaceae bacterium]
MDRDYKVVPASARCAELLGVPQGTEVLERHFVFRSKGEATQLSVSCYPYDLVKGTRVADPINEPWPGGNIAQLRTLGVSVTRVTEQVTNRPPEPEEADLLRLGAEDSVFAIVRRMFADGRPVEFADIVLPAEGLEIDYDVNIPQPE